MEPSLATKGSEKRIEQIIRGITGLGSWAELCAKSIIDEFAVIPRDELPKRAPEVSLELLTAAGYTERSHGAPDPLGWVSNAVRDLDAWVEAHLGEVQCKKRRDELAAEFTAVPSYGGQLPYTQKLIDRIIELESRP